MDTKSFRLQPKSHDRSYRFYTGIANTSEQAIICSVGHRDGGTILVIKFDPAGNYLGYDRYDSALKYSEFAPVFERAHPEVPKEWLPGRIGGAFEDAITAEERALRDSLGYVPGVITVKPFFIEELDVGVYQYPDWLAEVAEDPESFQEDRPDLLESLEAWDRDNDFVFHRGNDYYVNGNTGIVWET